jgi:hypothetical protein
LVADERAPGLECDGVPHHCVQALAASATPGRAASDCEWRRASSTTGTTAARKPSRRRPVSRPAQSAPTPKNLGGARGAEARRAEAERERAQSPVGTEPKALVARAVGVAVGVPLAL